MPTVLRVGPYRIFFFSNESSEPAHVHVARDEKVAKVWLEPPAIARAGDFPPHEAARILKSVREHVPQLLRRWHEHHTRAK